MSRNTRKIGTVLIANRGEIALRIARTCRRLGIRVVQAYSDADRDSLPVRMADDAVRIGASAAAVSYLNMESILSAARACGADAIHPGYGFLSENADFAERCGGEGLIYIGCAPETIRLMGDKTAARSLVVELGIPVVPGGNVFPGNIEEARKVAGACGYPVLVKAAAGGGGRGMRVVAQPHHLSGAIEHASAEALASFGSGAIYLEKYLNKVKHIEVQVAGDGFNFVHLGERDCSVQRRHQKLLEEGPAHGLEPGIRKQLLESAIAIARHVGYRGVGTVEFILDSENSSFYFIEMNTRIQVEHPVTEMTTGLDLIELQIRVSAGEEIPYSQDEIKIRGHAIECRLNAENPSNGFLPGPGVIERVDFPMGCNIRIDTHVENGYELPRFYDSLIAKVVVWGQDRAEAIHSMDTTLAQIRLAGVPSTLSFHQNLMRDKGFQEGCTHTRYVSDTIYEHSRYRHLL